MTTVTLVLTEAWLTDAIDPSVSVHATYLTRSSSVQKDGEFRSYAEGRVRLVTNKHVSRTYPVTLQDITDADLRTLESLAGRVLLLRDVEGRRVFGSFLPVESADIYEPTGTLHDVSILFTELTYFEAV